MLWIERTQINRNKMESVFLQMEHWASMCGGRLCYLTTSATKVSVCFFNFLLHQFWWSEFTVSTLQPSQCALNLFATRQQTKIGHKKVEQVQKRIWENDGNCNLLHKKQLNMNYFRHSIFVLLLFSLSVSFSKCE